MYDDSEQLISRWLFPDRDVVSFRLSRTLLTRLRLKRTGKRSENFIAGPGL